MYQQYDSTSTQYWSYRDANKEGLNITTPVPVEYIRKYMPKVKAFCFQFDKTGFKIKKTDHAAYLEEIISAFPVVYIEIQRSTQLEKLPNCLIHKSLDSFKIAGCPKVKDFSLLGKITTLQTVQIIGGQYKLGKDFYELPRLMDLSLNAKEIEDLTYLPKLQNLRNLELFNLTIERLPKGIADFKLLNLLKLNHLDNLISLPDIGGMKKLQVLLLRNLPNLSTIPDQFEQLTEIRDVLLNSLGRNINEFHLPNSLFQNPNLQELVLQNCPIRQLPNTFNIQSSITKLNLGGLDIEQIPSSLGRLTKLQELNINSCPSLQNLNDTIDHLKNLKKLSLHHLNILVNLDFSFEMLPALEQLTLDNLPQVKILPEFGPDNKQLKKVFISNLLQLKKLPASLSLCQLLERLRLEDLSITTIPVEYRQLQHLTTFFMGNLPQLQYMSSDLIDMAKTSLSISNTPALRSEHIPIHEVTGFIKKNINPTLRPIIAYWLFENYGREPLTEEIKRGTLEALSIANSNVQLLLQQNLHHLNDNNQKLEELKIPANESVAIIGTTHNSKTHLKSQLKNLGFQIKTKITPSVKYVLIGKKPKLDTTFWDHPRIIFSEEEFINFRKKHDPGLFNQADIPKEYLENLRTLIWSTDPANELLALELVITNGLPQAFIPDFIVAAKTGKDLKVRKKIRSFLKGNLPIGALKVLSSRSILKSNHPPFYEYQKYISDAEVTQMVVAYYKRFGTATKHFFIYDDGHSPFRKEMLDAMLLEWLKKPNYLNISENLTESEINTLLSNPIFDGKLERLILSSKLIKKIPEEVFKHTTIKDLHLKGNFLSDTLPDALFDLYKLNKLTIYWDNLAHLPDKFDQAIRLRGLYIVNKNMLVLPSSFKQLTNLKIARFSAGIKEATIWKETMPNVKFLSPLRV